MVIVDVAAIFLYTHLVYPEVYNTIATFIAAYLVFLQGQQSEVKFIELGILLHSLVSISRV